MVTMLVSGLWHGFSLGMLVWGGLHGMFLISERIVYELKPTLRPGQLKPFGQLISWMITFFLVCLTWLPFYTATLKQAIRVFSSLFTNPVWFGEIQPIVPIFLIVFSFALDYLMQKYNDELWWKNLALPIRAIGLAACLMMLSAAILFQLDLPGKIFIYQGF